MYSHLRTLLAAGLLAAAGIFAVGTAVPAEAEAPRQQCFHCTPGGCFSNYVGVYSCGATGCGNIFPCDTGM